MKVLSIRPLVGEAVVFSDTDYPSHIRYSADNWCVLMGESWEPSYLNEKKLEAAYQAFKIKKPHHHPHCRANLGFVCSCVEAPAPNRPDNW